MQQEKICEQRENGHPYFVNDFCDFNGNKSIIQRKRKYNMKYLVYNKHTEKPIVIENKPEMTILDVIECDDEKVVFYIDAHHRVSFIRTKQTNISIEKVLDKVEKTPFFRNSIFSLFYVLVFFGIMRFRSYTFDEVKFTLGYDKSIDYNVHFLFPKKVREKFSLNTNRFALLFHLYWATIPLKEIYNHYLKTSDINTPVYIRLIHPDIHFIYNMKADSKDKYNKKHYLFNTKSYRLFREKSEVFVRKSISGQYVIVTTNVLSKLTILKEKLAYIISLVSLDKEKYDLYFEKFSAGASESAFELFKHAYKSGGNAIYILEKEHAEFKQLKQNFGNSLVKKNSFLSFYHIFLARSFISSDLATHIQRRLYDNDELVKEKILNNKNKVFLQHGVCLATNVFERGYFNKKVPIAPDYLLVNSQFEKRLFRDNTTYKESELITTGLPNLDLYVDSKKAKKTDITFMLTWRPWDLTGEIEKESYLDRYFSFIKLIEKNPFYRDKTINVILHPKSKIILQEQFPETYEKFEHLFYDGDIKDALLRTKVLISDYSSIVFYAFTGGTNIVFYWEDKERAEKEYGAPNILQRDIAFGDIVNHFEDLDATIVRNYMQEQSAHYQSVFSKLVEHTNGNNTERTYEFIQNNILNKGNMQENEASGEAIDTKKQVNPA